ncbi:MAG: hypothetical protein AAF961_07775, partial [Planctomycetota bacterium]
MHLVLLTVLAFTSFVAWPQQPKLELLAATGPIEEPALLTDVVLNAPFELAPMDELNSETIPDPTSSFLSQLASDASFEALNSATKGLSSDAESSLAGEIPGDLLSPIPGD